MLTKENNMTKNTIKTETINGHSIMTIGKAKVFLNQLNHKKLLASFDDPFKAKSDKYDFFSWDFVGSNNNLVLFASQLNKSMSFSNWQKFFTKLETPKTNINYQGVMALGKALANGHGIEKLKDVPPNTNVASSPTANLNTTEIVNQVLRDPRLVNQVVNQLKEGLAK
jgi:hypothetical protein